MWVVRFYNCYLDRLVWLLYFWLYGPSPIEKIEVSLGKMAPPDTVLFDQTPTIHPSIHPQHSPRITNSDSFHLKCEKCKFGFSWSFMRCTTSGGSQQEIWQELPAVWLRSSVIMKGSDPNSPKSLPLQGPAPKFTWTSSKKAVWKAVLCLLYM